MTVSNESEQAPMTNEEGVVFAFAHVSDDGLFSQARKPMSLLDAFAQHWLHTALTEAQKRLTNAQALLKEALEENKKLRRLAGRDGW
jgi:hypothetical protein